MPDLTYTDSRLAMVYDSLNPAAEDTAFYLRLAGQTSQRVLDVGCGTGQLALVFAQQGHHVTGADPARAMLAVARGKPGAEQVTWVESDAAGLELDGRFDLIILTGHVFQVFLTDDAIQGALLNLRKHLGVNGRLAFETRNPAVRAWEGWTREQDSEDVTVLGLGRVSVYYQVQAIIDNLVTFGTHFHFANGDTVVGTTRLRFMDQPELAAHLYRAGFANLEWFGNWDTSPLQADSPEIIVSAS